jgi:hypothetical protein
VSIARPNRRRQEAQMRLEEDVDPSTISPKVDGMLSTLDIEKKRLSITNGELLVFLCIGLGRLLADAEVKEFNLAMNFLLQAARDLDSHGTARTLHELIKGCEIERSH